MNTSDLINENVKFSDENDVLSHEIDKSFDEIE
mgnify:CR=1 FL=1